MKTASFLSCLLALFAPGGALAQTPPPPQASETGASVAPPSERSAASKPDKVAEATSEPTKAWDESRALALGMGNTLSGPSGILRSISADSGDPGTLRVSVTESYFSGNGLLCPNCETPSGGVSARSDSVSVSSQRLQLSLTPLEFLEAHAALRYRQTSSNRSEPRVIQISDDVWFGVKAFTPRLAERLWSVGGGVNLGLLSDASTVGIGAANVLFHGEGTLDLSRGQNKADVVPLRAHLNLGYLFDSSGAFASDIEKKRTAALGSRQRITRIERFGFDINRVDSVRLGLGAEGTFAYVRPFAEWSVDIPANRQGHKCHSSSLSAGDHCLVRDRRFEAIPSRLTLGVRGYPWLTPWTEGLGLLLAVDIGTGATSSFVEEVTPELPWSFHFGLAYAFDTRPRFVRVTTEKTIEVRISPPPAQYIEGTVLDARAGAPIAAAAVLFKDVDKPGMLTDANGRFRSIDLEAGAYAFRINKEGYAESECSVTVAAEEAPASAPANAPVSSTPAPRVNRVKCELSPLPTSGRIDGVIRDAESTQYVASATVRVGDARGRVLSLQTDEQGNFRIENVPPGAIRVQVEAEGYLPSAAELELKPRDTLAVQLSMHKRPKLSNVVVTKKELKLRKQVHFLHDSAEILVDSQALIEEIAEALRTRPEILAVEIQGHTDDTGAPDHNQTLSERRANAVRGALLLLGIEPSRLTARGYGQQQPLVPNVNAVNKAKNRRVQLMIQGP